MIKHQISTGKVLLAEPFMQDPNFKRAAILLTDYSEEGSIGFILSVVSTPFGLQRLVYLRKIGEVIELASEAVSARCQAAKCTYLKRAVREV